MNPSTKPNAAIILIAVFAIGPQLPGDCRGFGGGGVGGSGFRGGGPAFRDGRPLNVGYGGYRDDGYARDDAGDRDARPLDADRPSAFSRPYGGDSAADDHPSAFSRPYDDGKNTGSTNDTGVRNYFDRGSGDYANHSYGAQRSLATDGGFGRSFQTAQLPRGIAGGSASHVTMNVPANTMSTRGNTVRRAFNHYDAFRATWWRNHGGWYYGWWGDRWPWTWGYWGDLAGFWGWPVDDEPYYYDYGDNITYQGDQVYYGTQPAATSDQYYQQAQSIADAGSSDEGIPPSDNPAGAPAVAAQSQQLSKDWKSLGVFSLVQGSQSNSSTLFQLAVNKAGKVRGNYYNMLTDEVKPIKGSIDKKTKRVAWTVGDNKTVVYDTGLANLLKDQSPILVHLSRTNTQQWTLVRLKQPETPQKKT